MHDLTFTCMGCAMRLIADGADPGPGPRSAARHRQRASRASAPAPSSPGSTRTRGRPCRRRRSCAPRSRPRCGRPSARTASSTRRCSTPSSARGTPRRSGTHRRARTSPARSPRRRTRAPAAPHGERRWRGVAVDNAAGTITRPPGLRLDTGGTTKGLAADAAAQLLRDRGAGRVVADCGGDLRVAGAPADVVVEHPLTGAPAATLRVAGGVATSGLARRVWPHPGGGTAHHLLDPATGAPAWTGLISATALAPTALHAEALAKAALLRGPAGARRLLARRGGVLVHDDGAVERVGIDRPVARLRAADLRVAA